MTTPLAITVQIRETSKAPALDEKLKATTAVEREKVTILLGSSSWCVFQSHLSALNITLKS